MVRRPTREGISTRRFAAVMAGALALGAVVSTSAEAFAQKPKAAAKPRAGAAKPKTAPSAEEPPPPAAATESSDATAAPEKGIQGQTKGTTGTPVIAKEEGTSKEGVKTYKFGAVEVEGRLRSPQLIYFLRRVRAEFLAGDLGHRSFLRELADTQKKPTFR